MTSFTSNWIVDGAKFVDKSEYSCCWWNANASDRCRAYQVKFGEWSRTRETSPEAIRWTATSLWGCDETMGVGQGKNCQTTWWNRYKNLIVQRIVTRFLDNTWKTNCVCVSFRSGMAWARCSTSQRSNVTDANVFNARETGVGGERCEKCQQKHQRRVTHLHLFLPRIEVYLYSFSACNYIL